MRLILIDELEVSEGYRGSCCCPSALVPATAAQFSHRSILLQGVYAAMLQGKGGSWRQKCCNHHCICGIILNFHAGNSVPHLLGAYRERLTCSKRICICFSCDFLASLPCCTYVVEDISFVAASYECSFILN